MGRSGENVGTLRWIGGAELLELVSLDQAIRAIDGVMRALSQGRSIAPRRWAMPLTDDSRMALMPGALPDAGRFGVKVLSLFGAATRGALPSHQGVMLLFDMTDGRPLCAVDAASLTALRTAAATAVATRALARPGSDKLAIIGCGDQARMHIAAMRAILPLARVFLWNRNRQKANDLAMSLPVGIDTVVCDSPADAVRHADVICTLTSSPEPLLRGGDLRSGQHLNLVGSSTAGPSEIDDDVVAQARYLVDNREHALDQAAELRSAIQHGLVDSSHIVGEIGQVLSGEISGRTSSADLTIYKSLGHIAQDLAVADLAYAVSADASTSNRRFMINEL